MRIGGAIDVARQAVSRRHKKAARTKALRTLAGQISQKKAAASLGISRRALRASARRRAIAWPRTDVETGTKVIGAKLTRIDAEHLRLEAAELGYPSTPLPYGWRKAKAERYGVTGDHIRRILKGQKWPAKD